MILPYSPGKWLSRASDLCLDGACGSSGHHATGLLKFRESQRIKLAVPSRLSMAHRGEGYAMSDHYSGFTVDLEAVRSFGVGLLSDLTAHLSPEHDQILRTFVDTPSFGIRTASPVIQD